MSQKRILIVDDEPEVTMMVRMRLEASGYEVISANDGKSGLEKAKQENPDLVMLDVMMPKMDGYKVCGLLKADIRYNKIPVIMFTARAPEEEAEIMREVGADAYVNKPLNAEELLAKIKDLLGEG
ncbi:MAG: response regulator [Candidatus Omnitrophica bacterium]|nr:response regulator [Candidatus Omnitrophota bacterium]